MIRLCIVAICLVGLASAIAAEPPADDKATAALDKPYKFGFRETPLQDVCAFLGATYKVEFGIGEGSPPLAKITYRGKGDHLRDGLEELLKPHRLTFSVVGGKILIKPLPE